MNEEKEKILKLILGLYLADDRKSTLQLALRQARRLIGITQGEKATISKFQKRRSNNSIDVDIIAEIAMQAALDEEMDILTSLSLYLIVLDQLGHIFGSRSNKSNRVKFALEKCNIAAGLTDVELDEIADLRNSINHNFGLACYNPSKNMGVRKYIIHFDDDGTKKPIIDAIEEWEGDWCNKEENTSVHVYPLSLINFVEQVLISFIEKFQNREIRSPLCVEELKTRFTITTGSDNSIEKGW